MDRLLRRFGRGFPRELLYWGMGIWMVALIPTYFLQSLVRQAVQGGGSIITAFRAEPGTYALSLVNAVLAALLLVVGMAVYLRRKKLPEAERDEGGLTMGFGVGLIAQVFTGLSLVGAGFRLAQARLGPGRIHHCMRWLGICERALGMMIGRAATRIIDVDGRRLGDSDIVRAWIAESAAEIRAARLLVLHTAWRIDQAGAKAARDEISMIKFHVADVLQRVVDRALQVHGGLGMTDYTLLAWFFREERAARIYDGPDEVHKIAVAKHMLRNAGG